MLIQESKMKHVGFLILIAALLAFEGTTVMGLARKDR
jgi:hypothetical protein